MVALAVRHVHDIGSPLGRETFLIPMEWDANQYPIVNPGTGKVLPEDKRPDLPVHTFSPVPVIEDFESAALPLHWNTVRNTRKPYQSGEGSLVLQLVPETFKDEETPAFVGRRVQHHTFDVITKMHFTPENDNEEAGISLMVDDSSHYHFTLSKENGQPTLTLSSGRTKDPLLIKKKIDNIDTEAPLYLRITSEMHRYTFSYSTNGVDFTEVANNISGRILSATGMVFTGSYVGMYASSKGKDSNNQAAYEWFVYRGF